MGSYIMEYVKQIRVKLAEIEEFLGKINDDVYYLLTKEITEEIDKD